MELGFPNGKAFVFQTLRFHTSVGVKVSSNQRGESQHEQHKYEQENGFGGPLAVLQDDGYQFLAIRFLSVHCGTFSFLASVCHAWLATFARSSFSGSG